MLKKLQSPGIILDPLTLHHFVAQTTKSFLHQNCEHCSSVSIVSIVSNVAIVNIVKSKHWQMCQRIAQEFPEFRIQEHLYAKKFQRLEIPALLFFIKFGILYSRQVMYTSEHLLIIFFWFSAVPKYKKVSYCQRANIWLSIVGRPEGYGSMGPWGPSVCYISRPAGSARFKNHLSTHSVFLYFGQI